MTERQDSDTTGSKATDTTSVAIQADQPTETLGSPQDQHDRSDTVTITSSTLGQRDGTQSHFVPTFVTITISREVLHRYINYGEFAPAVYNTL